MTIQQSSKKFIPVLTVVMAALAAMSPLATDTYIAALPQIATEFGVGLNIAELTISLYFFGFAVGNFIGGPLSDSFGRKTVALVGVSLYGLAGLAIPLCPKIEYVLLLRFVQAFGGGFATVTTNVFIRDWYSGKQVARFITIISMIIGMAPLLAPVLGTWLIHWWGWRSVFVFLFGFALLLFLSVFFLIPESRPQHLLTRKLSGRHLLEKYRAFFASRQSTVMLFAISLPMAGLYVFITSASFIYIKYFGVDPMKFPLFFGSNVLLNMLLSLLNTYLLRRYKPEQILRAGLLIQLFAAVKIVDGFCIDSAFCRKPWIGVWKRFCYHSEPQSGGSRIGQCYHWHNALFAGLRHWQYFGCISYRNPNPFRNNFVGAFVEWKCVVVGCCEIEGVRRIGKIAGTAQTVP